VRVGRWNPRTGKPRRVYFYGKTREEAAEKHASPPLFRFRLLIEEKLALVRFRKNEPKHATGIAPAVVLLAEGMRVVVILLSNRFLLSSSKPANP